MYFDRFDICEGWYVWACEWGEYAVVTRLHRMGFRPGLSVSEGTLESENAQAIYNELTRRSEANPDWHR